MAIAGVNTDRVGEVKAKMGKLQLRKNYRDHSVQRKRFLAQQVASYLFLVRIPQADALIPLAEEYHVRTDARQNTLVQK